MVELSQRQTRTDEPTAKAKRPHGTHELDPSGPLGPSNYTPAERCPSRVALPRRPHYPRALRELRQFLPLRRGLGAHVSISISGAFAEAITEEVEDAHDTRNVPRRASSHRPSRLRMACSAPAVHLAVTSARRPCGSTKTQSTSQNRLKSSLMSVSVNR